MQCPRAGIERHQTAGMSSAALIHKHDASVKWLFGLSRQICGYGLAFPYTTSLSQPRWNEGKSTSGLYSVVSWPAYQLELLIVTPSASPSSCCPAISSIARGASGAIHWCHLGVLNFQPSWDRVHLPNRTRVFLFQSFRIWLRSGVHFPNRTRVFIL